jgi:sterol desaturase/sphingolipid hydroxylase (fatty acid hydroxylase superfamily)
MAGQGLAPQAAGGAMSEKQVSFRQQYRDSTPAWYRGEMHLGFTLVFTLGVIYYCASNIENATAWEWLMVVSMFLFGNYIEWAAHRYILHRPVKGLSMIYKRHVATHHRFFTHEDLSFNDHKDWRALLFPPFAPVMFVLSALPIALLVGTLWSANAGYITVIAMTGYYLMYEGLHTLSHIENSPFLDKLPLVNTVRRMHVSHHHPALMQTKNFNLTFPICDALFGTSDLERGFWGTLFNGMSQEHMREEDRRYDEYKGGKLHRWPTDEESAAAGVAAVEKKQA